jgi:hypothetical protein
MFSVGSVKANSFGLVLHLVYLDDDHLDGNGAWLGFWCDYPDFSTQGESLDDVKAHLHDLLADIRSGDIPGLP